MTDLTPNIVQNNKLRIDENYKTLLREIKARLKKSQLRAAIKVNLELIQFYWEIGKLILTQQAQSKWGDKLFDVLANDLSRSFPNTKGFSKTNLKNMRLFAMHYANGEFSQALPDQLTWTHHIILLQTIDMEDLTQKQWYGMQVIENGWSYRQLQEQIHSKLYERQADKAIKTTNFQERLPMLKSNLAQEMIKEPYKFHFLTIGEDAHEKEIQRGLLTHVKQFLMELGQGFALYGTITLFGYLIKGLKLIY